MSRERAFDLELERMMTGPKMTLSAPRGDVGRIVVTVDGQDAVLAPGQNFATFGYAAVFVAEEAVDACHIAIG